MEQTPASSNNTKNPEDVLSVRDYLSQCLVNWKWFLGCLVAFLLIGGLYILRQQPQYMREMAVLIKDQEGGTGADISSAFSSMGFMSSNTNVNNELISLTSPATLYEVIARLGLDVTYSKPGMFHRDVLYGKDQPLTVKFLDLEEQQSGGFDIEMKEDGSAVLSRFYIYEEGKKRKIKEEVKCAPGFSTVRTPIGRIQIQKNPGYSPKPSQASEPIKNRISRSGMQSAVENYQERLKGDLVEKDAEVISLSFRDVSQQRAVDVLNTIIVVYNENWVEDKNKVATATSQFIDRRLKDVVLQLDAVDKDIAAYKEDHQILNVMASTEVNMQRNELVGTEMLKLSNELSMTNYIREYLNNPANTYAVIPVNTGIGSPQLESQIAVYNNLLLNRNNLVANSSDTNPIVVDYDLQLKGMRESIVKAVAAQVAALNASMQHYGSVKGQTQNQLASAPGQARYLLGVERQQKVIESLYLYLLQKKEENELTQAYSADNTRIITPPTGSLKPVSPKKVLILLVAFVLGLAVPGVALYIAESANTKVRSRKDLDKLAVPFAGEIPMAKGRKSLVSLAGRLQNRRKPKPGKLEDVDVTVEAGRRDAINEAFRIVRGNIDFMVGKGQASNVIMMTSYNPGSGKSFISFNLGISFSLKNKRVLVIDGDLRHGSISQYVGMPAKGLSNYLTGADDDWQKYVVHAGKDGSVFDVLPIGHRPPNPSELLDNGKIGPLLEEARQEYDYVLIDCPPVDVVVDTQIIEKYIDRTIFIVRAGLLEKKAVIQINEIYKNKRFKQISVILNGTDSAHSTYYSKGATSDYYNN